MEHKNPEFTILIMILIGGRFVLGSTLQSKFQISLKSDKTVVGLNKLNLTTKYFS